jgi:hypothetical protein
LGQIENLDAGETIRRRDALIHFCYSLRSELNSALPAA